MYKKFTLIKVYIICALLSWPIISGMEYANFRSIGCSENHWREDAGFSIAWGAIAVIEWPIFLPGTYLITGFAEKGIWKWNSCEEWLNHEKKSI